METANPINYYALSRKTWQSFYRDGIPPLNEAELQQIKGFNDQISLQDVRDIYIPLTHLIHVYMKEYESLQLGKDLFMQQYTGLTPFVIGVAGSVAVGKSTTARLLQMILARTFPKKDVQLITTDGFLYPNSELEKRNLLSRKGFPESYDMPHLIQFLNQVKSGKRELKAPVYSHSVYDIIPDAYDLVDQPDILIVEGINVLQLPMNEQIYISDFFDFSVYVDADAALIEQWYLERFGALLDIAVKDPTNFYYPYAKGNRDEAFRMAKKVWQDVNLKNLTDFILPTKNRADLILHKTTHHKIDKIFLRKY